MIQDPGFDLTEMNVIDRAAHVAMMSHGGDKNKHDGELYMLHVHRVAYLVKQANGTDHQIAVAYLHDVVEDTFVTLNDLRLLFDDSIVKSVDAITKRDGESEDQYLERVKANRDARFVKFFGDSMDNFRRNHLITDNDKALKFARRYSKVFSVLAFDFRGQRSVLDRNYIG